MLERIEPGTLLTHKTKTEWGLGKVVAANGAAVWVYFLGDLHPSPDRRVHKFSLPTDRLQIGPETSHPELDCLPPFLNERFQVAETSLTLQHARERFLGYFPRGFSDPGFWDRERGYKVAAHERFRDQFAPVAGDLIARNNFVALRSALLNVYHPESESEIRLNLMNPRFEFPAFKESVEADGPMVEYVAAALEFSAQKRPTEAAFGRLAEATAKLPSRSGGAPLEKWTVLTWLPYVADPTSHIFLKPETTKAFAAAIPFELQYSPHLNHRTYARLQEMAQLLKKKLNDSALNPEKRELDMIDVQSFMWVVREYGKPAK